MGGERPTTRRPWRPISRTSWGASSRAVTTPHRCAGPIFRKRMARNGLWVSRHSKTKWHSVPWSWRQYTSRISSPARMASDQAARPIKRWMLSEQPSWVKEYDGVSMLILRNPDKGFSGCGLETIAGLKVALGLERVDLVGGNGRDDVNEGIDDGSMLGQIEGRELLDMADVGHVPGIQQGFIV